ncbi:Hypothetical predicted protein [Paramuricea clavata]|uniref:Uncharacterized protein n=1 Tax=Paramuricea clavata TaxID=317549 RepID=A0A7D9I494_PARCT|nr:Hypothetical predicted protein [Paramuricea clavata]
MKRKVLLSYLENYNKYDRTTGPDSTCSPSKRFGSKINQNMVEKNTRQQVERSKFESAGYSGHNNLNVSIAEKAKEDDLHVTSPVQGNKERNNHSSSNWLAQREITFGRDNNASFHNRNGESLV